MRGLKILKSAVAGFDLKNRFVQRVAVLSSGTALGQVVFVLSLPILTRLYSPAELGTFAVFVAVLNILVTVASLRYQLAIPLADDEAEAVNVFGLACIVTLATSFAAGAAIWLGGETICGQLNSKALIGYLPIFPFGLLILGGHQILSYWAIRCGAFGALGRAKVMQAVVTAVAQVGLAVLFGGSGGLIIGYLLGFSAALVWLLYGTAIISGTCWRHLRPKSLRRVALRYRSFPLFSSASGVFNEAGIQAAPLLLATLYGTQVAGWFALSQRVVGAPMGILGRSVAQVYFGEAARKRAEGKPALLALFSSVSRQLLMLGGAPLAIAGILSPLVFPFLFGPQWESSGWYLLLLTPMMIMQFVVVPLSQTLNVIERQGLQLCWDMGRLLAVVSALVMSSLYGANHFQAIAGYGAVMLLFYLALYLLARLGITSFGETRRDENAEPLATAAVGD